METFKVMNHPSNQWIQTIYAHNPASVRANDTAWLEAYYSFTQLRTENSQKQTVQITVDLL